MEAREDVTFTFDRFCLVHLSLCEVRHLQDACKYFYLQHTTEVDRSLYFQVFMVAMYHSYKISFS